MPSENAVSFGRDLAARFIRVQSFAGIGTGNLSNPQEVGLIDTFVPGITTLFAHQRYEAIRLGIRRAGRVANRLNDTVPFHLAVNGNGIIMHTQIVRSFGITDYEELLAAVLAEIQNEFEGTVISFAEAVRIDRARQGINLLRAGALTYSIVRSRNLIRLVVRFVLRALLSEVRG